jgi:hypothetical protein
MVTQFPRPNDITDLWQSAGCSIRIEGFQRIIGVESHSTLVQRVTWSNVLEELEEDQRVVNIIISILVNLPSDTGILIEFRACFLVEGIAVEWLPLSINFTPWKGERQLLL